MKKLMIAAAIVCAAATSQAASFNWTTVAQEEKAFGVQAANVVDNGPYAASTKGADRLYKSKGDWNYVLTLYAAGTDNIVGSANGVMEFDPDFGYVNTMGIEIENAAQNTTYDYKIVISGVQDNLRARGVVGDYDYSAATIEAVMESSLITDMMGATFINDLPIEWTVSGVTSVPEPTSGLLLLLGVAGLALRRRRA